MFVLSANGEMLSTEETDDSSVIRLEHTDETGWRCEACGESLSEETDGYATEESESLVCDAYDPHDGPTVDDESAPDFCEGPHRPVRVPLSWANSAAVHTDPDEDSITLTISVGDPRGAFALTVRRIPDGTPDNAGRLIMHTPYPGEPMAHATLTTHHAGTYWVS